VFFIALIVNLDGAPRWRSLPINPGVVQVRTGLRSELGRLGWPSSIT
jgi:hypothetical protein